MALIRCEHHKPHGRTKTYTVRVRPRGYPSTAAICGNTACDQPGYVWLESGEVSAWNSGQTVFRLPTNAAKIAVEPVPC